MTVPKKWSAAPHAVVSVRPDYSRGHQWLTPYGDHCAGKLKGNRTAHIRFDLLHGL
jgi:hypothetical protein